jgi:hypothetical protein
MAEQKNVRWSSKKRQDGRAKAKQKMKDGRAKKCKMVEQKLKKKKCKMAEQKNVRWSSKSYKNARRPSTKTQGGLRSSRS